ncbi:MAG: zinc ABC transporter substrate-binding protein, partial [Chloroflexi bacterium]|nr:zinc ABC transporter substrate-binding protein [Chloroflexota bacterium]
MTGTLPRRALALCLVVVVAAIVAAGCSDDSDNASTELNVVTTLPLLADIVSNIAADGAAIDSLLPPGADPHTFEPSPSDARKIAEADVIFANGLGLEPSLLRVIGANISSQAVLVELAEASIGAGVLTLPGQGSANPHLWMDPEIGREYAAIVRDTLSLVDPGGSATYSSNYETYSAALDDTAQYMRDTTAVVPPDGRLIIASHDAFGYLARAIDFEVAGFVVPGPGQDVSPDDISKLITTIDDLGIPAVFTEPQTSVETRVLEQIASDVGVEVCQL